MKLFKVLTIVWHVLILIAIMIAYLFMFKLLTQYAEEIDLHVSIIIAAKIAFVILYLHIIFLYNERLEKTMNDIRKQNEQQRILNEESKKIEQCLNVVRRAKNGKV